VYDHDPGELDDLGWEEFIRRQWDAVYTAYRTGRGRRTLCRGWADLLEAGLDCSQELADLLVRAEILDRADRDLELTTDPRGLVTGMSLVMITCCSFSRALLVSAFIRASSAGTSAAERCAGLSR